MKNPLRKVETHFFPLFHMSEIMLEFENVLSKCFPSHAFNNSLGKVK
jgi:hypothetical protein